MVSKIRRFRVLGAPVNVVSMGQAIDYVERCVRNSDKPNVIVAINPEKVYALRESTVLAESVEAAGLLIPDGIGVVCALRMRGIAASRLAGADLMHAICRRAAEVGYRVYLFGGAEAVNARTRERLASLYPGIRIVGSHHGFISIDNAQWLIDDINASGAEILFVALGSPKQEEWVGRYSGALTTVRVIQGVGGTFDTIAGSVKRAPVLWQRLNLEWLYRLLKQPSRFGRQRRLVRFIGDALREWVTSARWSSPDVTP